jgi:HlyD family secretion protein
MESRIGVVLTPEGPESSHTGDRMKKHLKWIVPAIAAVLVIVVVMQVRRGGGEASAQDGTEQDESILGGRTGTCEIGEINVLLTEVGEIQPESMVLVKSKVSGKIMSLHVEEGDDVRRGQLLAKVEPDMAQARTVASLKSGYGRAKVNMERARQDYEIDLELHSAGHISDEELSLSKDDYDIARIEYQSALEQMKLAEEDGVSMDLDAESEELLDIVSPASGSVILIEVEEGEIVTSGAVSYTSGTTLMTVADLSRMQIKAGVNEVDVGKIRFGQDVVIDVDAYPNVKYNGVITHIAPAARDEQGVKIFDVEIDIVDSDERLRPGMTANIEIQGDHKTDILTVPIEAVFKKQGRYVAYVFDGSENEPVEREVVTGISNISSVEIVEGLTEGDVVALYDPELEGGELSEDEQRRQRMARGGRG